MLAAALLSGLAPARAGGPPLLPNDRLESAARYSAQHEGLALIVWQRGRTRLERYANGGAKRTEQRVFSVTKSFWGLAALRMQQEGLLRLGEKVSDTVVEWKDDPLRREILVSDLLGMQSGLDPAYALLDGDGTRDREAAVLGVGALAPRATEFRYGPANMDALGLLMARKLAAHGLKLTPFGYLDRKVLRPLGIRPPFWKNDLSGTPTMASGARLTARDLLRFGRMLNRRGRYHLHRIVGPAAFDAMWRGSAVNPAYGLTCWLNAPAARADAEEVDVEAILNAGGTYPGWERACFSRAAPPDTVVLLGSYNQRVYVVPSLDLVVVRQGKGTTFKDAEFLALLFAEPRVAEPRVTERRVTERRAAAAAAPRGTSRCVRRADARPRASSRGSRGAG